MTMARQVTCPHQLKWEKSNIILPCTRLSVKSNNDYHKPKSRPQAELTCFKSPFDNHCFKHLPYGIVLLGGPFGQGTLWGLGGILTMSLTAGPGTEVGTEQVLSVLKKKTKLLIKSMSKFFLSGSFTIYAIASNKCLPPLLNSRKKGQMTHRGREWNISISTHCRHTNCRTVRIHPAGEQDSSCLLSEWHVRGLNVVHCRLSLQILA